jgi:thioesterase domain-containing protein
VLDEHQQLLPIGVPGEIFIGGTGLATGYLGDENLTRAKFVSDSVSGQPGARLYRTEDRGRLLADGNLEFIERLDNQVKIRGFRIELGEVETVIAQHPSVRDVVVTVWNEGTDKRSLAAYVVSKPDLEAGTLNCFVQERLPDYMVPARIVMLEVLPITPSGKVDHRALPSPGSVDRGPEMESAWAPARTPLEEVLSGIWANTLKVDSVGVHDNFFALGGHSLLALQLIHEMNSAFGLELPVRLLFSEPTVAGQAREIERVRAAADQRRRANYPPLIPLRPHGSKPPFFLVAGGFGGEAELIIYAGLTRYLDSRRPFYGLRIRGVDDVVEPHESVEAMAAEHVAEIRRVQPHGPYFIGGSCVGGVVALEIAQQLHAQGETIGSLILVDSRYPSWSWLCKYLLWRIWYFGVLPLVQSRSQGQAKFLAQLKDKITMLFKPSPEQRVGGERIRIARKYLHRTIRYSPRTYHGPITLVLCEKQGSGDPTRVWRDVAGAGLHIQQVPGDHFTHLREYAAITAARLDACLDAASDRLRKGAGTETIGGDGVGT